MEETLIHFGGEVKHVGEGRFTGYLVRFSDADSKDLAGDYFTPETDFGIKSGAPSPIYFNHRLPLKTRDGKEIVVKAKVGEGTLTLTDEGVLIDAIVYNRESYEKAIVNAGKAKRLGWSSGTAAHLVDREEDGRIKTWPLGLDSSLTPIPCEPMNCALPAKSYGAVKFQPLEDVPTEAPKGTLAAKLNQHVEDLTDDGHSRDAILATMAAEAGLDVKAVTTHLIGDERPTDANLKAYSRALRVDYDALKQVVRRDYSQSVRGMFESMLSGKSVTRGDIEAAYLTVTTRLASAAQTSNLAGVQFDLKAKLDEAADTQAQYLKSHTFAEITAHIESGSDEPFQLKSVLTDLAATEGLDLDEHSQLTASAARELAQRFRGFHETRVKSGRVLSEKNRTRIGELQRQLQAVQEDLQNLLEESQPMATEAEKNAAMSEYLRQKWRAAQLGVS